MGNELTVTVNNPDVIALCPKDNRVDIACDKVEIEVNGRLYKMGWNSKRQALKIETQIMEPKGGDFELRDIEVHV